MKPFAILILLTVSSLFSACTTRPAHEETVAGRTPQSESNWDAERDPSTRVLLDVPNSQLMLTVLRSFRGMLARRSGLPVGEAPAEGVQMFSVNDASQLVGDIANSLSLRKLKAGTAYLKYVDLLKGGVATSHGSFTCNRGQNGGQCEVLQNSDFHIQLLYKFEFNVMDDGSVHPRAFTAAGIDVCPDDGYSSVCKSPLPEFEDLLPH